MSWNYDLDLDNAADILIALAFPERREILDVIRKSKELTKKSLPSIPKIKKLSLSQEKLEEHLKLLEKGKLVKAYQKNDRTFYGIDERGKNAYTHYYEAIDTILPFLNVSDVQDVPTLRTRFKILKFLNYDEEGKTLEEIENKLNTPCDRLQDHLSQIKGVSYDEKTGKYNTNPLPRNLRRSAFLNAIYG